MSTLEIAELTVETDVPLPPSLDEETIGRLALHVLQEEQADGAWTLGFRFVDDPEMQRMHLEFMDLDSPTDIMTFPIDEEWSFDEVETAERGGDIVISVDRAADQAIEGGWDTEQELRFLIVHGLLHLLGWDDHADEDRTAMLDRQRVLLSSWIASIGD